MEMETGMMTIGDKIIMIPGTEMITEIKVTLIGMLNIIPIIKEEITDHYHNNNLDKQLHHSDPET